MCIHCIIRKIWTLIYVRIHSARSAVHDNAVFLDDIWSDLLILYGSRAFVSADKDRLKTQRLQSVVDSLGGTTCTEDKRLFVVFVEQRLDALCKSDNVAVVSLQYGVITLVSNFHNIHSTNSSGLCAYRVEETDYLFLVGNSNIESPELRIRIENFR